MQNGTPAPAPRPLLLEAVTLSRFLFLGAHLPTACLPIHQFGPYLLSCGKTGLGSSTLTSPALPLPSGAVLMTVTSQGTNFHYTSSVYTLCFIPELTEPHHSLLSEFPARLFPPSAPPPGSAQPPSPTLPPGPPAACYTALPRGLCHHRPISCLHRSLVSGCLFTALLCWTGILVAS